MLASVSASERLRLAKKAMPTGPELARVRDYLPKSEVVQGWVTSSVKLRRGPLYGAAEPMHAAPSRQPCRRRHGAWHNTFVFFKFEDLGCR